jgi:YebC/PmpR family DNA-binding regulatory protein
MSGHSKWSQIKRQKGVADARRGQLFTKLAREITVAARQGGADVNTNFRLRLAVQKARESNMPADNIERAAKRGAGESDAAVLEEVTYEGYGPGGTAILIQAVTDNRNRTVADLRRVLTRGAGSLGEAGSVAWNFESRGVITIDASKADSDELALQAIDAGAEDVKLEDDVVEVYTRPEDMEGVKRSLEDAGLAISSAEVSMVPKTVVELGEKDAHSALRLLERIEELDDVQRVFSNADFSEQALETYEAAS